MPKKPKVVPIHARPAKPASLLSAPHAGTSRSMVCIIGKQRILFELTATARVLPSWPDKQATVVPISKSSTKNTR